MKRIPWLAALLLAWVSLPSQALESVDYELPDYSLSYSPERDPFVNGRDAIVLANKTGRKVLIEVGGEWCGWCKQLDAMVARDPELSDLLHNQFVLLKVNVSVDGDNAEFLKGLPTFTGYPQFFVAGASGHIVLSQSPTDFVRNGRYSYALWKHFLRTVGDPDWLPGSASP